MKKVLFISFDFPPQGGSNTLRGTKLVKYLSEFGWQPIVLSSDTNWNWDEGLLKEVPAHVPVYRATWPRWIRRFLHVSKSTTVDTQNRIVRPPKPNRAKALFSRLLKPWLIPEVNRFWVPEAQRMALQIFQEHGYDAVVTTAPPNSTHLVGAEIHSRLKIPWIVDYQDTWTVDMQEIYPYGLLSYKLQQRVERRILENCSLATIVTPLLLKRTIETFGAHLNSKTRLLLNGFDPADFSAPPPPLDADFTIAYLGTLLGILVHNALPEGLRQALERDAEFRRAAHFQFTGKVDPAYAARFAGLESNVEFLPFVPYETAIARMRSARLLVLVQSNTPANRTVCPNKLYEYIAARRPTLGLLPPGSASDILNAWPLGRVVAPDDPTAIATALLEMFHSTYKNEGNIDLPESMIDRYSRKTQAGELAAMLDEVTAKA